MESLLRWGIENSASAGGDGSAPPPAPRKDLDPAIIDMILGKPDAEQMKEDMSIATDQKKSEEERLAALDHLEMLIEQIDNANNLEKLGMWEPLQTLLTSESTTNSIRMQTLWVIGTALQNNPAAQHAYLAHHPLPALTALLAPSPASSPAIRSKVIYALSGLLKHHAVAVEALGGIDMDGWEALRDALGDPDITVRRKTIFLFNSLLTPSEAPEPSAGSSTSNMHAPTTGDNAAVHPNSHASMVTDPSSTHTSPFALAAMEKHGILDRIIESLVQPVPYGEDGEEIDADADFEEKGVRVLHTYAKACSGPFTPEQKATLRSWIENCEKDAGDAARLAEKWGMGVTELAELRSKL